jgi:hypothetical protein
MCLNERSYKKRKKKRKTNHHPFSAPFAEKQKGEKKKGKRIIIDLVRHLQ